MEGIMKSIALTLAATGLLISCGGHSSSHSSKTGPILDPATVDKFEQELLSRRPGMVTLTKESGNYVSLEWNEGTGKFEPKFYPLDELQKETILKIDGDFIYTLSETPNYREVRKESIQKLLKELTQEMPDGAVLTMNGNILSLKFDAGWSYDYETNGHKLSVGTDVAITASVNLENIRCSENTSMKAKNSASIDGAPIALPDTASENVGSCAPSISKSELKLIPLTDVSYCDETVETNDDDSFKCLQNVDMSDLVKE